MKGEGYEQEIWTRNLDIKGRGEYYELGWGGGWFLFYFIAHETSYNLFHKLNTWSPVFQEIYPPKLHQFAYVTDGACTEDEILSMELIIMKVIFQSGISSTSVFKNA